jgi:hypothetical protein
MLFLFEKYIWDDAIGSPMKKSSLALSLVGLLIVAAVAWYVISPAFIVVETDEASPLEDDTDAVPTTGPVDADTTPTPIIDDAMDDMTDEDKEAFEQAVDQSAADSKEMSQDMPMSPQLLSRAEFMARAHDVAGNAQLIDTADGRVLRFEDFDTINGPNLHVYLASSLGDDDFIDLGPLPATKGSFNIDLDAQVDTDQYSKVLVWCVPFRVLFSYADLS